MWIVLFVIMLDIIGFGIIGPTFPFFVRELGGGPEIMTLCLALFTGCLFISTPILGRMSDRYGRKPIMIYSLIGAVAGYILLAFADSIAMVAAARILSGLMAGNFGAAQAYITDVSNEQDRAKVMGYFGAALGLGFVIGPAIGSLMGGDSVQDINFKLPALTAAAMSLAALIGVIFFVKESLPREARQQHHQQQPSLLVSARAILKRETLLLVIICGALYQLASGFFEGIFPLWAADLGVIDGPKDMLPMLLASGITLVIVQAFAIGPLTQRFSERVLVKWSSLGVMLSIGLTTVAGSQGSVIAVTVLMSTLYGCAGILTTCAQTLVSKAANENERGMVMGVFSSVGTLGRTITTVLAGVMYGNLHIHSPYYAGALLTLLLWWLSRSLPLPLDKSNRQYR